MIWPTRNQIPMNMRLRTVWKNGIANIVNPGREALGGELAAYRVSTSHFNIVGNVGKEVPEFDFA
jgi:hypothetical protein